MTDPATNYRFGHSDQIYVCSRPGCDMLLSGLGHRRTPKTIAGVINDLLDGVHAGDVLGMCVRHGNVKAGVFYVSYTNTD